MCFIASNCTTGPAMPSRAPSDHFETDRTTGINLETTPAAALSPVCAELQNAYKVHLPQCKQSRNAGGKARWQMLSGTRREGTSRHCRRPAAAWQSRSARSLTCCNNDGSVSPSMSAEGGLAAAGALRRLPWALLAPVALLLVLLAPAYLTGMYVPSDSGASNPRLNRGAAASRRLPPSGRTQTTHPAPMLCTWQARHGGTPGACLLKILA